MRIGLIGGVERDERKLARVAMLRGYELEYHPGHLHGGMVQRLESLVERSQLVVIVTDVNSHGAVQIARRAAHKLGRTALVVRRCGPAKLEQLLDALDARAAYVGSEREALAAIAV